MICDGQLALWSFQKVVDPALHNLETGVESLVSEADRLPHEVQPAGLLAVGRQRLAVNVRHIRTPPPLVEVQSVAQVLAGGAGGAPSGPVRH